MVFYVGRYRNVERVVYDVEVVTPMFLGGAEQKSAELRGASIKGLLRFWWRALYGHAYKTEDVLLKAENERFGSTKLRSSVVLRVEGIDPVNINATPLPQGKMISEKGSNGNPRTFSILNYLAYGVDKKDYKRAFIQPTPKGIGGFKIWCEFTEKYRQETENALMALIKFGGLGAKSRNGFGSVHVSNPAILGKMPPIGVVSAFATINAQSVLFRGNPHKEWVGALSEIGELFRISRLGLDDKYRGDKRVYLGQPLVIRTNGKTITVSADRHSKPYFLHINKVPNGYQGQVLFMPYLFEPQEKRDKYNRVCEQMNANLEEHLIKVPHTQLFS